MQSYSSQRTEEVNRFPLLIFVPTKESCLQVQEEIASVNRITDFMQSNFSSTRLTILSILYMKNADTIYIKQQLATMNQETRVVIVHTTSYVNCFASFCRREISMFLRTLASSIVKQASTMSLTGAEYMWIMSSIVLCKYERS